MINSQKVSSRTRPCTISCSLRSNHPRRLLNPISCQRGDFNSTRLTMLWGNGLRRLVSVEDDPLVQTVVDSEVVTLLIELIKSWPEPKIWYEAAWALTNLCSGNTEQTKIFLDFGVVPGFTSLLQSGNNEVGEPSDLEIGKYYRRSAWISRFFFLNV